MARGVCPARAGRFSLALGEEIVSRLAVATAYAEPSTAASNGTGKKPPDTSGLSKRQRLDKLHGALWQEMSPLRTKWALIGQTVLPSRPKWCVTSQPAPAFGAILDNEAFRASRTMAAGFMSKLSSPYSQWFALTTMDATLDGMASVKRWLSDVRDAVLMVMERSNFYTEAETLYWDCGLFATAAMSIEEDAETVIRCETHAIGSYAIAQDSRRRVNHFAREWQDTAGNLAEAFGYDQLSAQAKRAITDKNETAKFTVRHMIYPNDGWDTQRSEYDATKKRFAECYWEPSSPLDDKQLLREGGYDDFPVAAPRWGPLAAGEVWGNCAPGFATLGDALMLQEMERQTLNAYRKEVSPTLVGGPSWRNKTVYATPGAVNVEDGVQAGQKPSLQPMNEVRVRFDQIEAKMEQIRWRIRQGFYADIMAPILSDERNQRATAAEIYQTRDEQYGMLGPVVTRQSDDFHVPAIDRIFGIMARRSAADWAVGRDSELLPAPPPELQGRALRVQLISTMAQAQKSIGVTALERHMLFVGQMAGMYGQPALDNTDADEVIREHAQATGVPPKGTRSPEETAQVRDARAQQMAAQQAAAAAPQMADAAKKLSETKLNQDSALDALAQAGAGG